MRRIVEGEQNFSVLIVHVAQKPTLRVIQQAVL
jgi:hypothetical protein